MGSFLFPYLNLHLKYTFPLLISRPLFSVNKGDSFLFKLVKLPNAPYSEKERNRYVGSYKKESKAKYVSDKERPVYSRSVFAAGTAKKIAQLLKNKCGDEAPEQPEHNQRGQDFELPDHPLTPAEWRTVKENDRSSRRFEIRMITRMLSTGADIDVAKSLLAYVALETGTLSYELLLKYLALCVQGNHHSEVFDVYDIMKSRFKALDTGACSLFVKGFSRTERWKEALPILENMKKAIVPSARNYGDVIDGASRYGDNAAAWALYSEILDKGLIPNQETWQTLFESGLSDPSNVERLQSVLYYMRDNQIYPKESLTKSIKAWFERLPGDKWKGSWSTAVPSAVCQSCQARLESIQLSEEEYRQLKDQVMKDVIEGRDVFNKTTPEELESFKAFVKRKPAFDVVVDGLNVANITAKGSQSETLLAVVSALEQQGLRILVLGRKHMLRPSRSWDRHHMSLVQKKAHCFFTDNISEDDPFLLYAALHSGNHCIFVSRDLMRDHKACLPNGAIRRLFFKWQRGHQLVLSTFVPGKRVRFQQIQSFDTIIQTDRTSWHIPYDEDGGDRCTYEVPQKWLCLSRVD
ncbi:mitochondrial ribonuclease P catalytic subunit isoform X1 [Anguilla rostrata]|uniref:mitochondrial ribonuclease P catalytic subunit isoform X1 n=1 Tax=Anguilla rostrata TaxID=7938 RepID=UPI0030D32A07